MTEHRNRLSTVADDGHRIWVYPDFVKGKYQKMRKVVAFLLLFVLMAGPWLRIQGEPLLLLNIVDHEFVILGQVFLAHDGFLFAWTMLTAAVVLIVVTVVFGRVFCGWVCPQTVFLEFVFRPIERWFEGKPQAQRRLDAGPWNFKKIARKGGKWSVFFGVSFAIANTFLAYFIGSEALLAIQTDPPGDHVAGLFSLIAFTGVFFFVFAWMREQVCSAVCPYGRLQGVLVDDQTVNVTYDVLRGEPRGKKGASHPKGDCVDCGLCKRVCPAGIDIRDGLQLECIHCALCIDACDDIMQRVDQSPGLIRYASAAQVATGAPFRPTRRAWAYLTLMLMMVVGLFGFLAVRDPLDFQVLRAAGAIPEANSAGEVTNLYSFSLVNKGHSEVNVVLRVVEPGFELVSLHGKALHLAPKDRTEGVFLLRSNAQGAMRTEVHIEVLGAKEILGHAETSFTRPYRGF